MNQNKYTRKKSNESTTHKPPLTPCMQIFETIKEQKLSIYKRYW